MKNLDNRSKREKRELNPMEEMILEDMNIVFENEVEKTKARKTRKTKKKKDQKQTQNYKTFKKGCDYLSLSAKYQSMGREIEDYRVGLYDLYDSYDSADDEENKNNIA